MRHLDLFSGIGGFALAASWVWGDEHEIVAFCEIDKYCQKVLRKHWPDVPIIEDIRDVTKETLADCTSKNAGELRCEDTKSDERESAQLLPDTCSRSGEITTRNNHWIDLLTGGFPCQPFSCAGKRAGKEDNRFLWPEMLRVIKEVRPRFILAENVPGIIKMELDNCLSSLEAEGYTTGTIIIPACAVDAPHRRDRVWIVAHAKERKDNGRERGIMEGEARQGRGCNPSADSFGEDVENSPRNGWGEVGTRESAARGQDVADTEYSASSRQRKNGRQILRNTEPERPNSSGTFCDSTEQGFQNGSGIKVGESRSESESQRSGWWSIEPNVCGIHHEFSQGMDGGGLNGSSKEGRSGKILPTLRDSAGTETVQRDSGRHESLSSEKVLRPNVHGSSLHAQQSVQRGSLQAAGENPEITLRDLRNYRESLQSSQGQKLEEQRPLQFSDALQFLSHKFASCTGRHPEEERESALLRLWEAIVQIGALQYMQDEAEEAWFTLSEADKDWCIMAGCHGCFWSEWPGIPRVAIGIKNRVNRLRALGNAIVPQVAAEIMQAIKAIDNPNAQG